MNESKGVMPVSVSAEIDISFKVSCQCYEDEVPTAEEMQVRFLDWLSKELDIDTADTVIAVRNLTVSSRAA